MSAPDQRHMELARKARAQLETMVISHPDVRMVSIGIDPDQRDTKPVLIVTIQQGAAVPAGIPNDVAGIPVRVIHGDYRLEQGE